MQKSINVHPKQLHTMLILMCSLVWFSFILYTIFHKLIFFIRIRLVLIFLWTLRHICISMQRMQVCREQQMSRCLFPGTGRILDGWMDGHRQLVILSARQRHSLKPVLSSTALRKSLGLPKTRVVHLFTAGCLLLKMRSTVGCVGHLQTPTV